VVDLATKSLLHDKLRFSITVSGVAFAVTLVFVQVGLFLGLLDNASITIEHIDADLWVTSRNTPNVDFAHTFPDTAVKRVRSVPGVERADNLIVWFVTVNLPSGAQEGSLVYALEDFSRWNVPWNVEQGDLADLKRGQYFFLDDSAVKRYGPFEVGEYREILGQRMKIIGRTKDARSFTTTPISFIDFERAQTLLENLEQATIAMINGHAVGGGWGLTLACDFRIAAAEAQFWIPEVDLGVPLGVASTTRFVRMVGPARAKEIIMECRRYPATEAQALGLLTRVVPRAELEGTVRAFAQMLLAKPFRPLAEMKARINTIARTGTPEVNAMTEGFLDREHS